MIPLNGHSPGNGRFIRLFMDLSSTCDIHCIHCFRTAAPPGAASISDDQIGKLEAQVFPRLVMLALSTTGEPLYLKSLPKALEAARRSRVPSVSITTNGGHLNADVSRLILESPVTLLIISMDAARPETYQAIRIGGQWDRLLRNIRNFVQQRQSYPENPVRIVLNYALMKQNAEEAGEFIRLAKELGVDSVSFEHLTIERPEMKDWSLIYSPGQANHLRSELEREAHEAGFPARIPGMVLEDLELFDGGLIESPCYHGKCKAVEDDWLFLLPSGNCYACLNLQDREPLGNLWEEDFDQIWRSFRYRIFRAKARYLHKVAGCDHCKSFVRPENGSHEMAYLSKRLTTVRMSR